MIKLPPDIEAAIAEHNRQQTEARAEAEAAKRYQILIQEFDELVNKHFNEAVREALGFKCHVDPKTPERGDRQYNFFIKFETPNEIGKTCPWTLTPEIAHRGTADNGSIWHWHLRYPNPRRELGSTDFAPQKTLFSNEISSVEFQLLLLIDEYRTQLTERMQKVEEMQVRERQEQQQQEEAAKAVLATHEEIKQEITEAIVAAQTNLWQFPEGGILTLYKLIWNIGGTVEEGQAHFDYESAWAASPEPDPDGFYSIHHSPYRRGEVTKPKKIKLTEAHKLQIEKVSYTNFDEIPDALKQKEWLTIHGIETFYPLSEVECYRRSSKTSYEQIFIGRTLVEWVRELIN